MLQLSSVARHLSGRHFRKIILTLYTVIQIKKATIWPSDKKTYQVRIVSGRRSQRRRKIETRTQGEVIYLSKNHLILLLSPKSLQSICRRIQALRGEGNNEMRLFIGKNQPIRKVVRSIKARVVTFHRAHRRRKKSSIKVALARKVPSKKGCAVYQVIAVIVGEINQRALSRGKICTTQELDRLHSFLVISNKYL